MERDHSSYRWSDYWNFCGFPKELLIKVENKKEMDEDVMIANIKNAFGNISFEALSKTNYEGR